MQHGLRAVGEDDMVDREIALDSRQLDRVAAVADLRLLVEDGRDLDHRSGSRLELAVDVRELLQRLEHELEQIERRDERPDCQGVMREERVAGPEHGAGRERAQELDRREEDREDLLRVDVLLAVCDVQLVELRLKGALPVERLHDRHPRDGLGDLRRDRGDAVARLDQRHVRRALEPAGEHERRRHGREERRALAASRRRAARPPRPAAGSRSRRA